MQYHVNWKWPCASLEGNERAASRARRTPTCTVQPHQVLVQVYAVGSAQPVRFETFRRNTQVPDRVMPKPKNPRRHGFGSHELGL